MTLGSFTVHVTLYLVTLILVTCHNIYFQFTINFHSKLIWEWKRVKYRFVSNISLFFFLSVWLTTVKCIKKYHAFRFNKHLVYVNSQVEMQYIFWENLGSHITTSQRGRHNRKQWQKKWNIRETETTDTCAIIAFHYLEAEGASQRPQLERVSTENIN